MLFMGKGRVARLDAERAILWTEKGTVPLRQADWEMSEKSGLAGGCGPGALGLRKGSI